MKCAIFYILTKRTLSTNQFPKWNRDMSRNQHLAHGLYRFVREGDAFLDKLAKESYFGLKSVNLLAKSRYASFGICDVQSYCQSLNFIVNFIFRQTHPAPQQLLCLQNFNPEEKDEQIENQFPQKITKDEKERIQSKIKKILNTNQLMKRNQQINYMKSSEAQQILTSIEQGSEIYIKIISAVKDKCPLLRNILIQSFKMGIQCFKVVMKDLQLVIILKEKNQQVLNYQRCELAIIFYVCELVQISPVPKNLKKYKQKYLQEVQKPLLLIKQLESKKLINHIRNNNDFNFPKFELEAYLKYRENKSSESGLCTIIRKINPDFLETNYTQFFCYARIWLYFMDLEEEQKKNAFKWVIYNVLKHSLGHKIAQSSLLHLNLKEGKFIDARVSQLDKKMSICISNQVLKCKQQFDEEEFEQFLEWIYY